jgi:hypothetical protein
MMKEVLPAIVEQANSERKLRERLVGWTYGCLYSQIVVTIAITIAVGLSYLHLSEGIIKIMFPTVGAEWAVCVIAAKGLFMRKERQDLLSLLDDPSSLTLKAFGTERHPPQHNRKSTSPERAPVS